MTQNIRKHMIEYTKYGLKTLLGVGPMSENIVDATIELADCFQSPLMLIASRRQIDSSYHGGGYVCNWTTENFSKYVKSKSKSHNIFLARDHGGPWQNDKEKISCPTIEEAMASAKVSFEADIDAGFRIIHIDPSIGLNGTVTPEESLQRAFELYQHCWEYAKVQNKDIAFEIGTEEQQAGGVGTLDDLEFQLDAISRFCQSANLPLPLYVVVQTGTKVMEKRNVGSFDVAVRVENQVPPEILVPKIVELCERYSIFLKQHNTDYLSDHALRAHPRLGIHAANVAPEFGVSETNGYFDVFEKCNLKTERDKFIQLALESKKWEKWMLPNTDASDIDRAKICGHYVFSTQEFSELKKSITKSAEKNGINLDDHLKQKVKSSILRYMNAFGLTRGTIECGLQ